MPIATYLERIKEKVPSSYNLLRITLPVVLGYMLGRVILDPYHRVVEVLVGFFIAAAAMLVKPSRAIAVFIVIFLFPAHLSIGTSNNVFILILLSTWIAQQVLASERISVKTPLDLPIIALSVAHLVSLLNVPHGYYAANFNKLSVYFTSVAIYYMVVNLTTDTPAVRRLIFAGAIGAAMMAAIGIFEITNPGKELLPYFFVSSHTAVGVAGVRAGAGFRIPSVLSQYCLFYLLLGVYLFTQEKLRFTRLVLALFLTAVLSVFVSTTMRGAVLAGAAGLVFLIWRSKTVFDTRKVLIGIVVCLVAFLVFHQLLSSSGLVPNLWQRFSELEQKRGSHVSRGEVMVEVFRRSLEHPFIGHGPLITLPHGFVATRAGNPHCQYALYFYTLGLFGLGSFLWLLVSLFRVSSEALRAGGQNRFLLGLMVIFQTFLVIFVLHEIVDDYSSSFNYPLFIWYFFGLTVATRNVILREAGRTGKDIGSGFTNSRLDAKWRHTGINARVT
jgi:hypothetical protein